MIDSSETLTAALEDFGVAVSIEGTTTTLTGLFSESSVEISQDGREIQTDQPLLELAAEDGAAITSNATVLVIAGVRYQCFERTKPLNGSVVLYLTRDF
jgi:hypothetical protein